MAAPQAAAAPSALKSAEAAPALKAAAAPPRKPGHGLWGTVERALLYPPVMGVFVGSILLSSALSTAALALIALRPHCPGTWVLAATLVALALLPLGRPPGWAAAFISYACRVSEDYFSARVIVEDEGALSADKPYVIALEPHSSLPTSVPVVFGTLSTMLPPALRGRTHALVSSVCFKFPLVRHLYHWWGFRPITRRSMTRLLGRGKAVVLIPGGVQECLVMEGDGAEVAFLRKRKGFIRVAMQAGADVVPAFAFGQTQAYGWLRPGPPLCSEATVAAISRKIGMVPLLLLGRWGSPVPFPAPLTVAVGAPLRLPRHDSPPDDLVQQHLDKYIAELEALFERHKAAAGHKHTVLRVL